MKSLFAICFLCFLAVCSADEEVTELKIETIQKAEKCERPASRGDMLSMHYKGSLLNGAEFDSSYTRGEPFKFQLGVGQVIKGWDEGLLNICPGEKRKLIIPSHLGYGDVGAGERIPPKSTLVFEVECLGVEDGPAPVNIFKEIDFNNDKQLSREELSQYLKKQVPDGAANDEALNHDQLVEDIFQHEDRDKNGYISHDEFNGPKHDEL